ncbi:hypothetical protein OG871_08690 [Kitasatospora sp. NBC_00374]|uniref:hypothetical protein n=1 Tax=Kitasatospora sp. NBC_00374 TaxID=2975964 RepID=UPI003252DBEB
MSEVNANELLERIRRARDWARRRESDALAAGIGEPAAGAPATGAPALEATVHRIVADVLDEILSPGRWDRRRP